MSVRATSWTTLVLSLALAVSSGCSESASSDSGAGMEELAGAMEAQEAADQKEQARLAAEQKAEEARQAAAQQSAEPARTAAGRSGVGEGGYFNAIIGARRHALNETERWPWVQAVQHFKAEHGRLPKDHAEFMSKIVEPLELNLGYKEENQEFLYEPNEGEWGELYVVDVEQPPGK